MGAFLLVADNAVNFDTGSALATLARQCGTSHYPAFRLSAYTLYLFPKKHSDTVRHSFTSSRSHFFTGTPFFPGKPLSEAGRPGFRREDADGIFFLLTHDERGLRFTTDRAGLYSVYHTSCGGILSSSFLALCSGLSSLTPDREALTENLLTGTLIGPSTVFREIRRFEPSEPFLFRGLCHDPLPPASVMLPPARNRREGLKIQLGVLDEWFSGLRAAAGDGISTGITGGLDSRLLLALCRRHFSSDNLRVYSHLRAVQDNDFIYGREVCAKAGLSFINEPVTDIFTASSAQKAEAMEEGMLFNDGQIRTHAFWFEEFNTASYAERVMGDMGLGINGIGGEQYRNNERMIMPRRNMYSWIYNELLTSFSGVEAAGRKTLGNVAEGLRSRIAARLGAGENDKADLLFIKRYMNEIYNPANRALRACHENRRAFFLSPFALHTLSTAAYGAIPHLGPSLGFEAGMIAMTDPGMASVNSVYGFSFNRREPLHRSLPAIVYSNLVPPDAVRWMRKLSGAGTTGRWTKLRDSGGIFAESAAAAASLSLPVDTGRLLTRTDTGPLVFAAGYLMMSLEQKIRF